MANILVVGVYLADKVNTAAHLIEELGASKQHSVVQQWAALALEDYKRSNLPSTLLVITERTPKFKILNQLTKNANDFDWLIICDDDVEIQEGFLDAFIGLTEKYDFALSQPSRTTDSYTDHSIVQVIPGIQARRTRFVEIGPIVAIRRDAMPLLLPFPDDINMGWGLDFIWPHLLELNHLRLGIVDASPVAHRLRPPATFYDGNVAHQEMSWNLANYAHLSFDEACTILEAYI